MGTVLQVRGRLLTVTLAAQLLVMASCAESTGETIAPGDLVGSWSLVATGVVLTFESGQAGQLYHLRDPQGAYGQWLEGGSDLLVRGFWRVLGQSLFFDDEAGPIACPILDDRFVITMNAGKTSMTLSHLGDDCLQRALILDDFLWRRSSDDS